MATVVQVGEPTAELLALAGAVEQYLAASPVSRLSDADVVAEVRALEVLHRQLQAGDVPLICELEQRGLGASYGVRSTKGMLQDLLRLSPRDAHNRVEAAQLLGERVTFTGEPMPPLLPATADAYAAGRISAEHVHAVIATVDDLPDQLAPDERRQVDQILAEVADQCAPRDVTTAGVRILETLNADGRGPSEADQQRTRRLMLHRRRDGSYELNGRLTPECGAETEAVLNAMAAPRPTVTDDSGQDLPDERTATQRLHDALQDVVGLALRADTLDITGRRAQLIITAHTTADGASASAGDASTADGGVSPGARDPRVSDAPADGPEPNRDDSNRDDSNRDDSNRDDSNRDDSNRDDSNRDDSNRDDSNRDDSNRDDSDGANSDDSAQEGPAFDGPAFGGPNRVGFDVVSDGPRSGPRSGVIGRVAWTSFGQGLSARTAMWLCDTAMRASVTVGPTGAVLAYGQTRRFATPAQIRALIARDGGCSFPGCDHPPEWCDAHHVIAWLDHGPTDLENLTLVCGYHHRNFQRIGWQCRMTNGVPEWIPPPLVDPDQRPRRNQRFLLRTL